MDDADRGTQIDAPDRPTAMGDGGLASGLRAWVVWFGAGRLAAVALAVVAVVAGGIWLLRAPSPPTEAGLPYAGAGTTTVATGAPAASLGTAPQTTAAFLTVHVAGAVEEPGVYTLASGARVHAAIEAAGGPRPEGDPGALNLAAAVADGERIYVPAVGESVPIDAVAPVGSLPPAGPIDVNQATLVELDTLPGIGPTTAQAIIDHRTANGPFATIDDLEAVRGIGPATLEAIRALVQV